MEGKKSLEVFNSMPVSQAVIKNAIPAMVAMLMVLVYNLADTFFIGQTHDAYQVAAISLATPVFLMSISQIFMNGMIAEYGDMAVAGSGVAMKVTMAAICYLFVNQIVGVFLTDTSAFSYAVDFARILLTTSTLFGIFYVLTNALQACGAAVSSLIINLSRQGIIYIPALFILRSVFGVNGLIWAQPVADILSIGLVAVLYLITTRKIMKKVINKSCID